MDVTQVIGLIFALLFFHMKFKFILILTLTLWNCLSKTQTVVSKNDTYHFQSGGLLNILNGAIIEGSSGHGGIQPDYLVDLEHEKFQKFLAKAKYIGSTEVDFWDKIRKIINLIDGETFKYVNYKNPYYLRLLKKARIEKRELRLSEYLSCQAGVCREFGLFTHFALKAAGIPNNFVYAKIQRASNYDNFNIIEDHAFVVVTYENVEWVIDPYYWGFNGFQLADLMRPEGITINSKNAPIATPGPGFRRIININNYPKVWIPKNEKQGICKELFYK